MSREKAIDYTALVRRALREVVRGVLEEAASEGFPGEHHAYLTFRTTGDGVVLPPHLLQRFPEEITIVLQNQFWNLLVDEEALSVTLAFDGKRHRLSFPWDSLVSFVDPEAKFGLRFEEEAPADPETAEEGEAPQGGGELVSLDDFRRKQ